jgi:serine protease Do
MHRLHVSALILAVVAGPAPALEPDRLYEQVSRSVFVVVAANLEKGTASAGSGVVVAPGKIVTTCRVVAGASRIRIERGNDSYGATLEYADARRDLCQLDVTGLAAPAVAAGSSAALRIGQRVYAIGAPRGQEVTLLEGMISSLRAGDSADAPQIQTTAPLASGSAGGGLFDADGRLVAITTFGYRPRGESQNLGFAIPGDWIRDLAQRGKEGVVAVASAEPERGGAQRLAAPDVARAAGDMPKPGDTWTYTAVDLRYRARDRSRKFVHTIQSVEGGNIVERVSANDKPLGDFSFSPGRVAVARTGVLDVSPFAAAYGDLNAGQSWGKVPVRVLDSGMAATVRDPWLINRAYVAGAEKIVVPAGILDTVKVVIQGQVHSLVLGTASMAATSGYLRFNATVWYAPSVKRTAKILIQGANFTDLYELESYSVR